MGYASLTRVATQSTTMPRTAYRVGSDWSSQALTPVKCKDEGQELQLLLEQNLDLLPGDQINEEDPRRWLLIRREMPVHDPGTGDARWSVDLFLVDQDAVPTLVECKRVLDTRARREVVGQMLDYAANGHFYWTREHLREYATQAAEKKGSTLDAALQALGIDNLEETDQFFDRIVNNLREGQMRLIFFLEESPYELRSIVDFLNRQTERTEILIVEARQFESDGIRIVVPSVFGYTEQARRIKKTVTVTTPGRQKWTEPMFFDAFAEAHGDERAQQMSRWHQAMQERGYQARLGTGTQRGSISYVLASTFRRSVVTVYTDGELTVNLHWLNDSADERLAQEKLFALIKDRTGLPINDQNEYAKFDLEQWWSAKDSLLNVLETLTSTSADQPS
jgi:hypothetical protein